MAAPLSAIAAVVVLVVALVVVVARAAGRRRLPAAWTATVSRVDFAPPGGQAPALTFEFVSPVDAATLEGTLATLDSFVVGAGSPTPAADAAPFLALLTAGPGGRGPVPFVPVAAGGGAPRKASAVTTNTLPAGAPVRDRPLAATGVGVLRFAPAPR
jgi:hypothetical protein